MAETKQSVILSIDQGTSGSKAIVFSLDGTVLASKTEEYSIEYPRPGYVEIDPDSLLKSVYSACEGALREYEDQRGGREDVAAIGISNQRESFLLWDDSGSPVSPIVVWQCKRSVEYCNELAGNEEFASLVRRRTGLLVDPYFSGTKVAVLAQDEALRENIAAGEITFGTVDTWLLHSLTGGKETATDYTNASRTMLFDINRLRWDEDLIAEFGLKGLKMPEARPSDAGFGETDLGGLLRKPVPISGVIGDSHAAAFGEGLFRPGESKVTLGTGSSILMNVGNKPISSKNGLVSTICWSCGGRTDYALEGIIVSCGSTLNWLRDGLGIAKDGKEIDSLAQAVPDSAGVFLIPGFSGIGAPWWKNDAKASIVGLDFGHDKRHIASAALDSIVFQVTDVLSAMSSDSENPITGIKADGGITSSRPVMENLSALAGCPVGVPAMKQASAWGAALVAGLGAGLYPDLKTIDSLIATKETGFIEAIAERPLRERYEGWKEILQDY